MAKFKEVLLVVNPISGDISKDKAQRQVEQEVKQHNAHFHLYKTTGKNDADEIKELVKEKEIDRLVIAGGDGTINLVADAVKDFDVSIGLIPAGSANGLCTNLQIPQQLEQQVQIALSDHCIELDMLCLNEKICLHLSDLGINAELIRNYEGSNIRGKFGYLLQTIPTLIKSEYPFEFRIETDGKEFVREGVLLGIANANKYGTGANVNPEGKPNDGIFEILVFKRLNFFDILKTLRNESRIDPEFLETIPTTEATITCKQPISFQIDGEFIGKETKIDVSIIPQKLKVAVPVNYNP